MNTETYCDNLSDLDRVAAIQAIHLALIQIQAMQRGATNIDNSEAIARLTDCMRQAGHVGFK